MEKVFIDASGLLKLYRKLNNLAKIAHVIAFCSRSDAGLVLDLTFQCLYGTILNILVILK